MDRVRFVKKMYFAGENQTDEHRMVYSFSIMNDFCKANLLIKVE